MPGFSLASAGKDAKKIRAFHVRGTSEARNNASVRDLRGHVVAE